MGMQMSLIFRLLWGSFSTYWVLLSQPCCEGVYVFLLCIVVSCSADIPGMPSLFLGEIRGSWSGGEWNLGKWRNRGTERDAVVGMYYMREVYFFFKLRE